MYAGALQDPVLSAVVSAIADQQHLHLRKFRVSGLGFWNWGLGFRGLRFWGSGFLSRRFYV